MLTPVMACYETDVSFYAGLSIGLWISLLVGLGTSFFLSRKKSYADQIEEMMFEHIVQQLKMMNIEDACEQPIDDEEYDADDTDADTDADTDTQGTDDDTHEEEDQDGDDSTEKSPDIVEVKETNDSNPISEQTETASPSDSSDDTLETNTPRKRYCKRRKNA